MVAGNYDTVISPPLLLASTWIHFGSVDLLLTVLWNLPDTSVKMAGYPQHLTTEERQKIHNALQEKLHPESISYRSGTGGKVAYLEGWKSLELANSIFGYDGWSSSVIECVVDACEQGREGRYSIGVHALIRVQIAGGAFHEDIGYGIMENCKSKVQGLQKAKKEAITDGIKRALRLFGNALGNSIYDKDHIKQAKSAQRSAPVNSHTSRPVPVYSTSTPVANSHRLGPSNPAQPQTQNQTSSGSKRPPGHGPPANNYSNAKKQKVPPPNQGTPLIVAEDSKNFIMTEELQNIILDGCLLSDEEIDEQPPPAPRPLAPSNKPSANSTSTKTKSAKKKIAEAPLYPKPAVPPKNLESDLRLIPGPNDPTYNTNNKQVANPPPATNKPVDDDPDEYGEMNDALFEGILVGLENIDPGPTKKSPYKNYNNANNENKLSGNIPGFT
eukprot:Nk52_evm30s370 gene=Nk52_evmTU30s370